MNKKKSQECEIVQDLLPLYYDDVCSPSSKKFVHQHLENCEICKNFYEELKNDSVALRDFAAHPFLFIKKPVIYAPVPVSKNRDPA